MAEREPLVNDQSKGPWLNSAGDPYDPQILFFRVEDLLRYEKLYCDAGKLFLPAVQKGSTAAAHILARWDRQKKDAAATVTPAVRDSAPTAEVTIPSAKLQAVRNLITSGAIPANSKQGTIQTKLKELYGAGYGNPLMGRILKILRAEGVYSGQTRSRPKHTPK